MNAAAPMNAPGQTHDVRAENKDAINDPGNAADVHRPMSSTINRTR